MAGEFETNPEAIKAELAEVDKKSAELNNQRTDLYARFEAGEIDQEEKEESDRTISLEMEKLDQKRYELREALGVQSLVDELDEAIDLLLDIVENRDSREIVFDEVINEACFSVFGHSSDQLSTHDPNFKLVIDAVKSNYPELS